MSSYMFYKKTGVAHRMLGDQPATTYLPTSHNNIIPTYKMSYFTLQPIFKVLNKKHFNPMLNATDYIRTKLTLCVKVIYY